MKTRIKNLTTRQRDILEHMLLFFDSNDAMPSQRCVANAMKCVQTNIVMIQRALIKKGWLEQNEEGKLKRTPGCIKVYYSTHPTYNAKTDPTRIEAL